MRAHDALPHPGSIVPTEHAGGDMEVGSLVPPSGDDCRAASLAWRHCFRWRPPQKVAVQSIAGAPHLLDAAYRSAAVQRSPGEQRRPATREMPLKKPGGALVGRLSSETSRLLLASLLTTCISLLRSAPSNHIFHQLLFHCSLLRSPPFKSRPVFDEPSGACRTALRGLPH